MFTRMLFLWATGALLLPLIWGTVFGSEDDDGEHEDTTPTPTPDYDYNFTFDYYFYNTSIIPDPTINYDSYEILRDTKSQGNTGSVLVYRHYAILAGLLMLQICQQI